MKHLQERRLIDAICNAKQPLLGICLGMQLLTSYSKEGNVDTLNIIKSETTLLPKTELPLPHMGWNKVNYEKNHPLFKGIEQDSYFYFVHSYAVATNQSTIATSNYGTVFSAALGFNNFYGVQFHPERSGKNGALLLKNFMENI